MYRRMCAGAIVFFVFAGSVYAQPDATLAGYLKTADAIIIGILDRDELTSILYTRPPRYGSHLHFTPESVVRGPFKNGKSFTASHTIVQMEKPKYPVCRQVVVTLEQDPDRKVWTVTYFEIANDDNIKQAKAAK